MGTPMTRPDRSFSTPAGALFHALSESVPFAPLDTVNYVHLLSTSCLDWVRG